MALVSIPGGMHWCLGFDWTGWGTSNSNTAINSLNAATDKTAFIGRVFIAGRPGSAKTISAAGGGSIWLRTVAVTFADGATSISVGIQDVATGAGPPGRPDASFDVESAAIVGGGGGFAANTWTQVTMTGGAGSKSIAHGDLVSVVVDMTARGGADSVQFMGGSAVTLQTSMAAQFESSAWSTVARQALCVIQFDDGTLGVMDMVLPPTSTQTVETWQDGDNPDERGMLFQVPWDCKVDAIVLFGNRPAGTPTFRARLYADPLGTPSSLYSVDWSGTSMASSTGGLMTLSMPSEISLTKNTTYCVAIKSTNTTSVSVMAATLLNESYRAFLPAGTTLAKGTRNADSGAFSAQSPAVTMYQLAVRISALPDTSSSLVARLRPMIGGMVSMSGGMQ